MSDKKEFMTDLSEDLQSLTYSDPNNHEEVLIVLLERLHLYAAKQLEVLLDIRDDNRNNHVDIMDFLADIRGNQK